MLLAHSSPAEHGVVLTLGVASIVVYAWAWLRSARPRPWRLVAWTAGIVTLQLSVLPAMEDWALRSFHRPHGPAPDDDRDHGSAARGRRTGADHSWACVRFVQDNQVRALGGPMVAGERCGCRRGRVRRRAQPHASDLDLRRRGSPIASSTTSNTSPTWPARSLSGRRSGHRVVQRHPCASGRSLLSSAAARCSVSSCCRHPHR